VGINRVVVDNYAIDALRRDLGTDELPITFVFNDTNSVPVSYFGDNVSIEEIMKAFSERGIKLAEVPMWWLGDHHMQATVAEFETFFDIPALSDISAQQQEALRNSLEADGFTRKPIIVNALAESGTMMVDQPQRVRMAAEMGYDRIPVVFNFIEPDLHLARCGPGTPVGSGGAISGGTTPIGGATVPPGTPIVPPDPEKPASGS
jgi:hypothetical protein